MAPLKDMSSLFIHTSTPVRVDLAGGTLDLWPIYLFMSNPLTINLGIDLCAETKFLVEKSKGTGKIKLISQDQVQSLECLAKDFLNLTAPPHLELHLRILRYFILNSDAYKEDQNFLNNYSLTLETKALSPSGAGLGGSSSLAISLAAAISMWTDSIDPEKIVKTQKRNWLIQIVKDIESQVIKAPAGLQDYYGAAFGSLQKIHWNIYSHDREEYAHESIGMLSERTLLFYSGKQHHSGLSNWEVYKKYLEKDQSTIKKFDSILKATHLLDKALINQNWEGVCSAINKEWAARQTLSENISTPEIDEACTNALKDGASAFKVCGAGGGGCFMILLPSSDPLLRAKILQSTTKGSISPLPFHINTDGLKVLEHKLK